MRKNLYSSLYLIGIALTFFSATTVPSINEMMSIEDQRKTGVIRLKQFQKMELARWLVKHGFYDRHDKIEPKTPPLTITKNIGTLVTLSDGSNWEIAPEDVHITKKWHLSDRIEVVKVKNPLYPFKLVNRSTKGGEFVKARFPFTL